MSSDEASTRKAARAAGWGAALVLAFVLLGGVLVLLRAGTDGAEAGGWPVVASAVGVGLVGLASITYGLVQLARPWRKT